MDKAREFWISKQYFDAPRKMVLDSPPDTNFPVDHVIEYSAYKILQARVQELEASNKEYHGYLREYVQKLASDNPKYLGLHLANVIVQDHKSLREKIQSLEARLAEAVSALTHIRSLPEYAQCFRDGVKVNATASEQLDNAKKCAADTLNKLQGDQP